MKRSSVPESAKSEDRQQPRQTPSTTQPETMAVPSMAGTRGTSSAALLALQRTLGNRATTRFIQAHVQPPNHAPRSATLSHIQRYTDDQLAKANDNLKLPLSKVQAILEVGEATGLFNEVYEAATNKYILNPDGLATMLTSFRAVMPKTEKGQTVPTTEPSTQPAKAPGGAAGFVRELLYGLEHMRQGLYVQYGAMAPDDLSTALAGVGLNNEAEQVRQQSSSVKLGDHLGGDVVIWGKRAGGKAGETVQHKVVDGEDQTGVENNLRFAIHQLAGKNKELAIQGTQHTADIVVMPNNKLAEAEPNVLIDIIEKRLKGLFQGKKLSSYVDVVRLSTSKYQIEYDTKTEKPSVVMFESHEKEKSPQGVLNTKTPSKWEEGSIKRPQSAVAEPEIPLVPQKKLKVEDMNTNEITAHISHLEKESGKQLEEMNISELSQIYGRIEDTKTAWLKKKNEASVKQRSDINKARQMWITKELKSLTPPTNSKEVKAWQQKQREDLEGKWDTTFPDQKQLLSDLQTSIDKIEDSIKIEGGEDAKLLERLDITMAKYDTQRKLLASYEEASKERAKYVKEKGGDKPSMDKIIELQQEWAENHKEQAILVEKNNELKERQRESIDRDKVLTQKKEEQRKKDEEEAKKVGNPLFEAVKAVLKKPAPKDLMDSLIVIRQQARHDAGMSALCAELSQQLLSAAKLADDGAIESKGLQNFTNALCKRKDYNNLQGDLGEITHAVRMALQPADERNGPVVLGTTALDLDSPKQPQEIDVSFESKDKNVLHIYEVAWDLKTLEKKLLGTEKQSQREGYVRVIEAQKKKTGREVRMTYVVHQTSPDYKEVIGTNVAPPTDKLGGDVKGEVKPSEAGAMAKILSKRGYYLSLGGKPFTPQEIGGWIK